MILVCRRVVHCKLIDLRMRDIIGRRGRWASKALLCYDGKWGDYSHSTEDFGAALPLTKLNVSRTCSLLDGTHLDDTFQTVEED